MANNTVTVLEKIDQCVEIATEIFGMTPETAKELGLLLQKHMIDMEEKSDKSIESEEDKSEDELFWEIVSNNLSFPKGFTMSLSEVGDDRFNVEIAKGNFRLAIPIQRPTYSDRFGLERSLITQTIKGLEKSFIDHNPDVNLASNQLISRLLSGPIAFDMVHIADTINLAELITAKEQLLTFVSGFTNEGKEDVFRIIVNEYEQLRVFALFQYVYIVYNAYTTDLWRKFSHELSNSSSLEIGELVVHVRKGAEDQSYLELSFGLNSDFIVISAETLTTKLLQLRFINLFRAAFVKHIQKRFIKGGFDE